ncbi:hypothetical protein [Oceanicoccus sp. KOV_DT_Chl]|uniref:DUF6940 family protein n=1 Tax=Oceanicoccus sp. KOV_DT_Chl TaxID=1904639 RepID=UPI000C7E47F9|nr:hypothetical protein [Oceanicoccus sp. KOV_DT_Chl]
MSWQFRQQSLQQGSVQHYQLLQVGQVLSFRQVLQLWQCNPQFCEFYNQLMAAVEFDAFFWELPALTLANIDRDFECVLVDSPDLKTVSSDPATFAPYFNSARAEAKNTVVCFDNLGGDARLVVPTPVSADADYTHLAKFVRAGLASQQRDYWQQLGASIESLLSEQPLWVSTSGLGVYWLHIRLDQRPKYYTYLPYKSVAF